jgi:hypothetical protein
MVEDITQLVLSPPRLLGQSLIRHGETSTKVEVRYEKLPSSSFTAYALPEYMFPDDEQEQDRCISLSVPQY